MNATLIENEQYATGDLPPQGVNKYEVVRELAAARKEFGVSDRELGVLQALLSFYPKTILGGNASDLLVYPSNAAICERLNGMPCSTMRRHLAKLINAGLILRRDSPNGKRYVKRYGDIPQAFGFDLTPLLTRYTEICETAEATRAQEEVFQRLRRAVSLMRRDLASLVEYGRQMRPDLAMWDELGDLAILTARDLRRGLSAGELEKLESKLFSALENVRNALEINKAEYMSTSDVKNEQHIQNSNKDTHESETYLEKSKGEVHEADHGTPNIPLRLVTSACPELTTYAPDGIRHWHDLVRVAEKVRPMMGISQSAWDEAVTIMGPEETSIVVLAILERFSEIKSPGGYLRSLTRKADSGGFSSGAMIMALISAKAA